MKKEQDAIKGEVRELRCGLDANNYHGRELEFVMDRHEQSRKSSVRIFDMKEEVNEKIEEATIKCIEDEIGIKVEPRDIDIVHRVGRRWENKPRAVLVKFISHKTKELIMRNKKKATNVKVKEDLAPGIKKKNDLIVNLKPGKTETVLYGTAQKLRTQPSTDVSINGDTINRVNQYEYLGVTFDRHMNFSEQLSKISKKVSQRINMLKRVRVNITSATANIIYNSMIAPMMLYCSPVYLGLPSVNQKFTKLETRAYKTIKTPLENAIPTKIKRSSAVEVFKYIHQLKKNDIIEFNVFHHNISTRGNGNRLVVPKSKNEAGRRSFNTQGALTFNSLPEHIRKEKSKITFKRLVKSFKF
eukprot:gene20697-22733_t